MKPVSFGTRDAPVRKVFGLFDMSSFSCGLLCQDLLCAGKFKQQQAIVKDCRFEIGGKPATSIRLMFLNLCVSDSTISIANFPSER